MVINHIFLITKKYIFTQKCKNKCTTFHQSTSNIAYHAVEMFRKGDDIKQNANTVKWQPLESLLRK